LLFIITHNIGENFLSHDFLNDFLAQIAISCYFLVCGCFLII